MFFSAVGAGIINALAGGGTLLTFPTLMAVGIPAIAANITSTVALCPGYLGATYAQRREFKGERKKLWLLLPAGAAGGIIGGILLLNTGEKLFSEMVPYLILTASILLALQNKVRSWLNKKSNNKRGNGIFLCALLVMAAAVYGGYFGAGLSVIVLSALGITLNDNLTRLNAFKQFIAFSVNISAAVFFLFSGQVVWGPAIIMAAGALTGGFIGGKLAGYIKPSLLRAIVVIAGVGIAIIYFAR